MCQHVFPFCFLSNTKIQTRASKIVPELKGLLTQHCLTKVKVPYDSLVVSMYVICTCESMVTEVLKEDKIDQNHKTES